MPAQFVDSLLQMAATSPLADDKRRILSDRLRLSASNMTIDPRQENSGNAGLLHHICILAIARAEHLYGDCAHERVVLHPSFQNHPTSAVAPLVDDPDSFGVTIGRLATTWEQVFYEIAHEMVHVLSPVANVSATRVATLEEGVAVKFAEDVYARWISVYTGFPPEISPVTQPDRSYYPAFLAASKVPDAVLKQVREAFGSFWAVDDFERFAALTSGYLSRVETAWLVAPFTYPSAQ